MSRKVGLFFLIKNVLFGLMQLHCFTSIQLLGLNVTASFGTSCYRFSVTIAANARFLAVSVLDLHLTAMQ